MEDHSSKTDLSKISGVEGAGSQTEAAEAEAALQKRRQTLKNRVLESGLVGLGGVALFAILPLFLGPVGGLVVAGIIVLAGVGLMAKTLYDLWQPETLTASATADNPAKPREGLLASETANQQTHTQTTQPAPINAARLTEPEAKNVESRHSRCVVLVFNTPSKECLNEAQKSIMEGLKAKWKREENDPEGERIDIIFMDPRKIDDPTHKDFEPLRKVDNRSLICFVGHCSKGSDSIASEKIYKGSELYDPQRHTGEKEVQEFSYQQIGKLLLGCIQNKEVKFSRPQYTQANLNSSNQRLRICIPSCHSGTDTDKLDPNGKIPKNGNSFASKLFGYLTQGPEALNDQFFNPESNKAGEILKCNVIGAKGFVFPCPTEADFFSRMMFLLSWIFLSIAEGLGIKASASDTDPREGDFHLYHVDTDNPATFFTGMEDPEVMFHLSGGVRMNERETSILSGKEMKEKLSEEMQHEQLLEDCEKLEKDNFETVHPLTWPIKQAINNGTVLPQSEVTEVNKALGNIQSPSVSPTLF